MYKISIKGFKIGHSLAIFPSMDMQGLGELLRHAREAAAMTRADLAARCGVGVRLVAELERGERPNVSLDSALRLLTAVGVTATFDAPGCAIWRAEDALAAAQARAAHRRRAWTGRIAPPDGTDDRREDASASADGIARTTRLSAELATLTRTG